METVATHNLWIWYSYVGVPGSNNDINVVDRSPRLVNWLKGHAPSCKFTVNDRVYRSCYLLCDGIYPPWSHVVKTISSPSTEREKWYAKKQEAVRKDVERCFGVLRARFSILAQPGPFWDHAMLQAVWHAAVIMHNMVIESEEYNEEHKPYISIVSSTSTSASAPLMFARLLS